MLMGAVIFLAFFFFAARICVNFHSSNHRLTLLVRNKRAQIWKCFQWRVCRTLCSHYQEIVGQIVWKVLSQDTPQMEVPQTSYLQWLLFLSFLCFCMLMIVCSCVTPIETVVH